MTDFTIKRNDTEPVLERTLKRDGSAVDLTNASVQFHMRARGSDSTTVDASASITDAPNGVVEYEWQAGDTDTAGFYEAEFEVTYADADVETFPNSGHLVVAINQDIN